MILRRYQNILHDDSVGRARSCDYFDIRRHSETREQILTYEPAQVLRHSRRKLNILAENSSNIKLDEMAEDESGVTNVKLGNRWSHAT